MEKLVSETRGNAIAIPTPHNHPLVELEHQRLRLQILENAQRLVIAQWSERPEKATPEAAVEAAETMLAFVTSETS